MLVARCASYGEGAAFLPLLGALRRAEPERALAGEDDAELVLSRLAALAGGEDTVSLGESYWAVRRLLEALSPALLDPRRRALGRAGAARPRRLPRRASHGRSLLVLCLTRPELDRSFGETVQLGPLDDEHAREIVPARARRGDTGAHRRARRGECALRRAARLVRGRRRRRAACPDAGSGPRRPPRTPRAVGADVLQQAAVVGREFSLGAVAALAGRRRRPQPAHALARAASSTRPRRPTRATTATRFHHVLLRDAAYASLTKADRADLHERAAAWLDRDGRGDDALVGYHLEQAAHCPAGARRGRR